MVYEDRRIDQTKKWGNVLLKDYKIANLNKKEEQEALTKQEKAWT
jgi:hypothetical protein